VVYWVDWWYRSLHTCVNLSQHLAWAGRPKSWSICDLDEILSRCTCTSCSL